LAPTPFPAAGLFEDVPHDRSMHGLDSGPHSACDAVLVLHERGEEQLLLPALEEQFSRQPEAGAGT
jgi:hypothetical protein